MKLDVSGLRYLSKDDFRVLVAVEMGMRNHEVVPVELIVSIAKLRHGGVNKILSHLLRQKLISHDGTTYEGFRLTYPGYDFLALNVLINRGHIAGLGRQIGVGKEADIYVASTPDGEEVALKFHRLGRTSFRAVKNKRDYLQRRSKGNWLYMSRLSAIKEFAFMKALYNRDFPTPTPIDCNRHVVCMSLCKGYPLYQVRNLVNSEEVYNNAISNVVRLAECGLIHCDFNEFNLMLDNDDNLTIIDFPQMISTSHENAKEYFDRDVHGVVKFFSRLEGGAYFPENIPQLSDIVADENSRVDQEVEASGFSNELAKDFEVLLQIKNEEEKNESDEESMDEESVDEESMNELVEIEEERIEVATTTETIGLEKQSKYVVSKADIQTQVKKNLNKKVQDAKLKGRNSAKLRIKGRRVHKEKL